MIYCNNWICLITEKCPFITGQAYPATERHRFLLLCKFKKNKADYVLSSWTLLNCGNGGDNIIRLIREPAALNLHIHLKWNAEYTSERDREITSYEDVTINSQPYELEPDGQLVYVVE